MRTILRVALLVVIAVVLLALVIAIGRGDSGPLEKAALAVLAILLVVAASLVRRRLA